MATTTIDAALLKKMFLTGAKNLEANKEWINELNVFPVPDGDTGTNMTLTIMAAAKEVGAIENPTMENLAKAISSGSLRGARGNSGVILSQLFRGFTKVIREYESLDTIVLSTAFQRATETAYKAVMKPKEGTILTVAKGISERAAELAMETDDLDVFMKGIIEHGDYVLSQTPEMLPVLKQAGVVDSGGQGLMQVIKGLYDGFWGKEADLSSIENSESVKTNITIQKSEETDITFGYCTEFIIMAEKEFTMTDEQDFKGYLSSIGDCVVVVSDDDIVKVHVHTNHPGQAIERALTYGALTSMKIDNMREEHEEKLIKDAEKISKNNGTAINNEQTAEATKEEDQTQEPRKPVGFIAVSVGEGLDEIFKGVGVDYLIQGGQTMNPSTEDMLEAINQVNADTVFILPNNSNIILAANQATYLAEDKQILVIPSKTVPQGITAMINYVADRTPEENLASMTEEMKRVHTGQITYAVRNTTIDDKEIHENDIMGLGDHSILSVGQDIETVALETVDAMMSDDAELISIYYGSDMTDEQAEAFAAKVEAKYPDFDIELHSGGQPIYYYILSVE
ncbi:MAG: DAK2 domain-containing protein [Lachnospiraceae bacterium]|nr:DAK2 domain-containing protein [Lachnospiraceae bacterium]